MTRIKIKSLLKDLPVQQLMKINITLISKMFIFYLEHCCPGLKAVSMVEIISTPSFTVICVWHLQDVLSGS